LPAGMISRRDRSIWNDSSEKPCRSHFKKSFRPIRRSKMPLAVRRTRLSVEPSSQVFDIFEYVSRRLFRHRIDPSFFIRYSPFAVS
jgi:hypothetical protein